MTEKRGRRRKQLLYDLRQTRRYWKLKEEAPDRTVWRKSFRRRYGSVVRLRNEWSCAYSSHRDNQLHTHVQTLVGIPEECSRKERNCVSGCEQWPSKGLFVSMARAFSVQWDFDDVCNYQVSRTTWGIRVWLYTGPTHTQGTCIGNLSCKLPLSEPLCGV